MDATLSKQPEATPPDGAVESMLDRPAAQVAQFVAASLTLWARALLKPWAVGRDIAAQSAWLPPPFAWLVLELFAAGVALRVFFAVQSVPASVEFSLLDDLRSGLGEVSLMSATLPTLPCVLIVALGARWVGSSFGCPDRIDADRFVSAACYAVGWQSGLVFVAFVGLIAMQLAGMEPSGQMSDEVDAAAPYAVAFMVLWGALLMGPTGRSLLPERTTVPALAAIASVILVAGPLSLFAIWTLGQSVDLRAADRIADSRQLRAQFGELGINVLETHSVEGLPQRRQLVIAFTSRSDSLLVVPRPETLPLLSMQSVLMRSEGTPVEVDPSGEAIRVVDSSLDYLPDRSLLIEPGATRCAEYTIEIPSDSPLSGATVKSSAPFGVAFHRREPDGRFEKGVATLYTQRVAATPLLGDSRADASTTR